MPGEARTRLDNARWMATKGSYCRSQYNPDEMYCRDRIAWLVSLVDDLAEALRERLDGERCYCTVGVTPYPCGPCAGRAALNRLAEEA